ncbi:hypothetical protein H310_08695 [Aphanomyces invadans]|uniref:Hyaluronan/mRNA-binding protein domain-containing protein n=1 Tax=Aphanomyces invadans TaxID=157072 RepID=A0A024TYZ8_9STRA|nr:hypothetical protein H310_08695 [Aphanomyces invadans]ETV98572.1 hypothetical protein H310_08695 [Aphanomyces invadans]|eukprot:XP_008872769.1 hypothetical protein H310_08695 [Aphanomyces invadans]
MASRNIFAALDSDDEDTKKVQVPAAPKAAEPTKPKTVKPRKEGEQPAKKQDGGRNGGRGGRGEGRGAREGGRGGRGEGRGPRPDGERAPRAEGERRPRSERAPRQDRPEGSTGTNLRAERERGERPDRSHHHAEGGERSERKRHFDRKSGTGRGKEVSKSGGGARNWGNEDDKAEQAAEAAVDEAVADEAKEIAAEEAAVPEVAVVEEEVDNTITYEEYLAKKKEARSNGELFAEKELRTVENDFDGAALISKEGKTPDFIESNFEKVFTKKTSGRKKNLVTDVGFSAPAINPPRFDRVEREDRGGRGGRGGREGGRGRGAGRGDAKKAAGGKANAPNVSDLNAFPSL